MFLREKGGSNLFRIGGKIHEQDIVIRKEMFFAGRGEKLPDMSFDNHSVKKRKSTIDFILKLF